MNPLLRHLPNALTVSRLGFTAGFLLLLYLARHDVNSGPDVPYEARTLLFWSFVLFVIAGITDVVDGHLARKLKVTGQFGRTFDPFVDKVLIAGGFILLTACFKASGLAWWMVAVILGREALVTILRHACEAKGYEFPATAAGKIKMFLQSFALGTIVIYLGWLQDARWANIFRDVVIWAAVVVTAFSALVYLGRLGNLKRQPDQMPQGKGDEKTPKST